MSTTNRSMWQDKAGEPSNIRESPVPTKLADNELLVKVQAWALNPADAMIQETHLSFITYPLVLGEDLSGTVEAAGSTAASTFQVGDRITALALRSAVTTREQGAFQNYVIVNSALACKIPTTLSFTDAAVFPLGICTAAHALFAKDYLALSFPKLNPPATTAGKSILIWGGSSCVGANAIQLCKAAGYVVVTTCSARNFDLVKSLGADKVLDYTRPSAIDEVVAELDAAAGPCAGIFNAAGPAAPCCQVSHKSKQKLFVAATNPILEGTCPEGVEAKWMFSSDGTVYYETRPATFGGFLPEALASGAYKVAPAAEVVETKGLEGVQVALDVMKKGVSAKKLVVSAT